MVGRLDKVKGVSLNEFSVREDNEKGEKRNQEQEEEPQDLCFTVKAEMERRRHH